MTRCIFALFYKLFEQFNQRSKISIKVLCKQKFGDKRTATLIPARASNILHC